MKFYLVTWRDDCMPEGVGYEFFGSKKEASAFFRKTKKEKAKVSYCSYTCPEGCTDHYKDESGYLRLETLTIPDNLTQREKIFYALKYQVV